MIPTNLDESLLVDDTPEYSDITFKVKADRLVGTIDALEALKQRIVIALSVERYEHEIYSWNFGLEVSDLIGQPIHYVVPEVARRITDALSLDPEIIGVDEWQFSQKGHALTTQFTVRTIYGDINMIKEVNV